MPNLDVTDVILDIDFLEVELYVTRNIQTIGTNGLAVDTPWIRSPIKFSGVVTQVDGKELHRMPDAERMTRQILIVTKFRLSSGTLGYDADVVKWRDAQYTVINVKNYSRYGRGFVEATCEMLPLQGAEPSPVAGTPVGMNP